MLGVQKTRLHLNAESVFIANGVVFDTDTLTVTTDRGEYPIKQQSIDAPDTLVVEAGVMLVAERINAGRVLSVATLATGSVMTKETRIVQTGETLTVTIGRLAGGVVLSGDVVDAIVGVYESVSAVMLGGFVSLIKSVANLVNNPQTCQHRDVTKRVTTLWG